MHNDVMNLGANYISMVVLAQRVVRCGKTCR